VGPDGDVVGVHCVVGADVCRTAHDSQDHGLVREQQIHTS